MTTSDPAAPRLPLDARCDPRVRPLLETQFEIEELERHAGSVIGLWPDATIAYFNPAWTRFADDNGGYPIIESEWGLGKNYLKAIPEPLVAFYEKLLFSKPTAEEQLKPGTHHYECSSPQRYPEFAMQLFPFSNGQGWLIIHSLATERPHDESSHLPSVPDPGQYMDGNGVDNQCPHCRRVLRHERPQHWDWVPQWVSHSPHFISHGICRT